MRRHPLFDILLVARAKIGLMSQGHTLREVNNAASLVGHDTMSSTIDAIIPADVVTPGSIVDEQPAVGKLGDGTIFKQIEAFFQTDIGKEILSILMALLKGFLIP